MTAARSKPKNVLQVLQLAAIDAKPPEIKDLEVAYEICKDLSLVSEEKNTALHLSVQNGFVEATEWLVTKEAKVARYNNKSYSPLVDAINSEKLDDTVKLQLATVLLRANDSKGTTEDRKACVQHTVESSAYKDYSSSSALIILINAKIKPEIKSKIALQLFSWIDQLAPADRVKHLNLNQEYPQFTPLGYACQQDALGIINLLLSRKGIFLNCGYIGAKRETVFPPTPNYDSDSDGHAYPSPTNFLKWLPSFYGFAIFSDSRKRLEYSLDSVSDFSPALLIAMRSSPGSIYALLDAGVANPRHMNRNTVWSKYFSFLHMKFRHLAPLFEYHPLMYDLYYFPDTIKDYDFKKIQELIPETLDAKGLIPEEIAVQHAAAIGRYYDTHHSDFEISRNDFGVKSIPYLEKAAESKRFPDCAFRVANRHVIGKNLQRAFHYFKLAALDDAHQARALVELKVLKPQLEKLEQEEKNQNSKAVEAEVAARLAHYKAEQERKLAESKDVKQSVAEVQPGAVAAVADRKQDAVLSPDDLFKQYSAAFLNITDPALLGKYIENLAALISTANNRRASYAYQSFLAPPPSIQIEGDAKSNTPAPGGPSPT